VLHVRSVGCKVTGFSTPRQPGLCGPKTTKTCPDKKKNYLSHCKYIGKIFIELFGHFGVAQCSISALRFLHSPARRKQSHRRSFFARRFGSCAGWKGAVLKPGDSAMRDAKTQILTQDAQRIAALTGSVVLLVVVLLITTFGGAAAPV
jgi:hypothetical protein